MAEAGAAVTVRKSGSARWALMRHHVPRIGLLACGLLALVVVRAHEPPSGLLAHFPFDGDLADATGNGFSAETIGRGDEPPAPLRTAEGRFGTALAFDGTSALRVPLDLHFELYPQITVTGWVYREREDSRGTLIGTGRGHGPEVTLVKGDMFSPHSNGRHLAHDAIREGRWYFFAATWDYQSGLQRLNWRARSSEEAFDVTDLKAPAQDLWIGARNDRSSFAEALRIDDVRIYGRVLSEQEIVGLRLGPDDTRVATGSREGNRPAESIHDRIGRVPDSAEQRAQSIGDDLDAIADGAQSAGSDAQAGQNDTVSRHSVVIDGSAQPGRTRYTIRASGRIEAVDGQLDGFEVTRNANDEVLDGVATGIVGSASDGFHVYGDIDGISLDDPTAADVYIDGQPLPQFQLATYSQQAHASLPEAQEGDPCGSADCSEMTTQWFLERVEFANEPSGDVQACGGFATVFNPLWAQNRDLILGALNSTTSGPVCQALTIPATAYATNRQLREQNRVAGTPCETADDLREQLMTASQTGRVDRSLTCAGGFILGRVWENCSSNEGGLGNVPDDLLSWYNNWLTDDGPASLGARAIEVGQDNTGTLLAPGNRRWFTPTVAQSNELSLRIDREDGNARTVARICKVDATNRFTFIDELSFDRVGTHVYTLEDVGGHFITVFLQTDGGITNTGRRFQYTLSLAP